MKLSVNVNGIKPLGTGRQLQRLLARINRVATEKRKAGSAGNRHIQAEPATKPNGR